MKAVAVALVASVATTTGCFSYKPMKALDDGERAEIASVAARLGPRRVHVNAPGGDVSAHEDGAPAARLATALAALGVPAVATPPEPEEQCVEVEADGALLGGNHHGIFLTLITAGVIPCVNSERAYRIRVVVPGGREMSAWHVVETPSVSGWVASPVSLLPGWRLAPLSPHLETGMEHEMDHVALFVARDIAGLLPAATDR